MIDVSWWRCTAAADTGWRAVRTLVDKAGLDQFLDLVPTAMWRPDEPVSNDDAARCNAYAAVVLLATKAR